MTCLADRVIGIGKEDGKRVAERGHGLVEGYPVLAEVRGRLGCIPLELIWHEGNLAGAQEPGECG